MKLATWNVNGVRARLARLIDWLRTSRPDVVCLQEIKVEDAGFPAADLAALGYQSAAFGQKTYNGVAILARAPLADVARGFADGGDEDQARFLAATVLGVHVMSCYVPNGSEVGSEKFAYKLSWMERLRAYLARRPAGESAALCGDLNVAPADLDCYDPAAWAGQILCSAEERAAFARLLEAGLIDVVRRLHPNEPMYTWWDYRQLAFPKNRGLRIDHILATAPLAPYVLAASVDREARKGAQPSDHAPLVCEIADA